MMAFFKHNDILLPVKRILEVHQNGGRRDGGKITNVTENIKIENLAKKKKLSYILVETDNGNWVSAGASVINQNALGIEIEPKEYYDIDGVDYTV
ncbi:MAG: hypothetical protein ABS939_15340 [Psychrobacillus sp.]